MFDHARNTICALALGLMPAMALADSDCLPLPLDYVFCPLDSDWTDAQQIDIGDGVVYEIGEKWLEVFALPQDFPDAIPLMGLLDMLTTQAEAAEEDDYAPSQILDRTEFSTSHLQVASMTQLVDMGGGDMEPMVIMLAEGTPGRILISLDPGMAVDPDTLFADMRALVEQIHPANGG